MIERWLRSWAELFDIIGGGAPYQEPLPVGSVGFRLHLWDTGLVIIGIYTDKPAHIERKDCPVILDDAAMAGPIRALIDSGKSFVTCTVYNGRERRIEWTRVAS